MGIHDVTAVDSCLGEYFNHLHMEDGDLVAMFYPISIGSAGKVQIPDPALLSDRT
jgi:hypothetical protein